MKQNLTLFSPRYRSLILVFSLHQVTKKVSEMSTKDKETGQEASNDIIEKDIPIVEEPSATTSATTSATANATSSSTMPIVEMSDDDEMIGSKGGDDDWQMIGAAAAASGSTAGAAAGAAAASPAVERAGSMTPAFSDSENSDKGKQPIKIEGSFT